MLFLQSLHEYSSINCMFVLRHFLWTKWTNKTCMEIKSRNPLCLQVPRDLIRLQHLAHASVALWATSFFFSTTVEPRVEWYKYLWACNVRRNGTYYIHVFFVVIFLDRNLYTCMDIESRTPLCLQVLEGLECLRHLPHGPRRQQRALISEFCVVFVLPHHSQSVTRPHL